MTADPPAGLIPFSPDWTIPPGDILVAELRERGMNRTALAVASGVAADVVDALIRGARPVDQEIAEGLHKALGPSAQFWLNLQVNHDAAVARGAVVTRLL